MDNSNQPQQPPMPNPVIPQPPVMPVQPNGVYPIPPKKGLSKGVLWGIIGGSIAFVLLIVGIILAVVFLSGPSKEDYKVALDHMQEFSKDMLSYAGSVSSADNAKEAKEEIDKINSKIDTHLDSLSKEKAMRDKEVKKLYDEMSGEYKKMRDSFSTAPKILSLMNCKYIYVRTYGRDANEVMKDFDDQTSKCSDALKELKDDSNEEVKKYVSDYSAYLSSYKEYLQKRLAGQIGVTSPTAPSSSKLYKALNKVTDSSKQAYEKEKALLKLLSEKAGVKSVVL